MTIQGAYQQLLTQLYEIYDDREAASISDWVIEHVTGLARIDRITNKSFRLSAAQSEALDLHASQLMAHTPVQYVLGEAWFAGLKLFVNSEVLIPRPETEELVEWVSATALEMQPQASTLLDVGTGSGCIALALKKKHGRIHMYACDVSAGALEVAQKNATANKLSIHYLQCDVLDAASWRQLPEADIIVSNPPYIRESEAAGMRRNVLSHEPHLALFVPDNNPLLFYDNIAAMGRQHLTKNGWLFFEINEALAAETQQLLEGKGYEAVEIKKDMQGKNRMIRGRLPG